MHANRKQQKNEKTALHISLAGSAVFILAEIFMAIYSHSQAVLLDAIYDGVELVMILFSIGLMPLLYQPSNEKHPFGFMQVESLFVVAKGFMMASVTIGLILNNVELVLSGGRHIDFTSIAWFEIFATVFSLAIILLLKKKKQTLNSPLVTMEIQEWRIDFSASFGMACAFLLPSFVKLPWFQALTPYLDQLIAIVLSVCMLPAPIKAVVSGVRDLFLLPPEQETVEHIRSTVTPILQEEGYGDLYFDIVKTSRKLWISVYVTFHKDLVSISKFASLQKQIIYELAKDYSDFYFELLPDIQFVEKGDGPK